jgi:hypothetical protein
VRVAAVLGAGSALGPAALDEHALGQLLGGGLREPTSCCSTDSSFHGATPSAAGGRVGETAGLRPRPARRRSGSGSELAAASGEHVFTLGRLSAFAQAAAAGPPCSNRAGVRCGRRSCSGFATNSPACGLPRPTPIPAALWAVLEALAADSATAKVLWLVSDFRLKMEVGHERPASGRDGRGGATSFVDPGHRRHAGELRDRAASTKPPRRAGHRVVLPIDVAVRKPNFRAGRARRR